MMATKREYGILTTDSFTINVKAYNLTDAYRKANKKLRDMINSRKYKGMLKDNSRLTASYMTYGRYGTNNTGWINTGVSIKLSDKYKR